MSSPLPIPAEIAQAAALLRAGRLVAFPTETVYGLGADAERPEAVAAIFAAKGRPADHPLIVHFAEPAALGRWAAEVPALAWRLAEAFWPGPLTLVLPRGPRVSRVATGGLDTVGLRVPAHPVALALLEAFGGAVAAPSANRFGAVSPTTAADVREDLGGAVDFVLDGGPCTVGVESTIVDLSGWAPAILRPGGITAEALARVVGAKVPVRSEGPVRTPGQLPSHYAPRARVELVAAEELGARAAALRASGLRVGVLRSGGAGAPEDGDEIGFPGDDGAAARGLYAALRELDRRGCQVVLAALPEEVGLGLAIADRLRRAAGPRPR